LPRLPIALVKALRAVLLLLAAAAAALAAAAEPAAVEFAALTVPSGALDTAVPEAGPPDGVT